MQKGAGARGNGQGYDPAGEGGWGEIEAAILCFFYSSFYAFCVFVLSYLHDHCNIFDLEAWLVWILIWNRSKICRGADHKFPWHVFLFCVAQLRRMQEMIAKMQAQMQKQGDEGEVPHMWKKGNSRRSRTCSSVWLRRHHSCKSLFQVICDCLTRETVDGRDDHLVTFYCLPLFCSNLTEDLEPFFFFFF